MNGVKASDNTREGKAPVTALYVGHRHKAGAAKGNRLMHERSNRRYMTALYKGWVREWVSPNSK